MLAAHADRERAVDVLKAGFSEGRLPQDEYERRVERAYRARTVGELSLLVADLPQGPSGMQPTVMGAPVPRTFMPAPLPPPMTNGKAVGSMVCGVLTTMTMGLTGIPAVILGHTARAEIKRTGEGGDGFALAGIILGWLSVAGWAFFLVLIAVLETSATP
ncbi:MULTISPECIES: DUF1707 and DUF4190 domain-containing protein [Streptomyces]|uniref:Uncharacterized protein n=2 Tax=Streptomyces TaxID=1883 RepID=M3DE95_9ACTN|nr:MULTISPECIES: DUF1707 and DUF4190 domain-containing protein [Streptomyces]EMF54932.1 hypothetical protein SBD_4600 [Streptomyces bottropensis ATCC 25435]KND34981.1 hypothetical protein IQ64_39310 [Streptomyces stelliscabiei]MBE1599386.1 hypothetical protein [Streptomyces stelliscabiei]MDX2520823.1 DUF1707 and DUF4190 domain-containing protein [Streptomyces stelliscabiei]MDX2554034.1 DUF1707 and DUF4190 domain-containing protein [Streptomyces stelliscabiei]